MTAWRDLDKGQTSNAAQNSARWTWRREKRPAFYVLLAIAVVAACWIATYAVIDSERKTRRDLDRTRAQELVGVLEVHTTNVLSYADTYLKAARHEFLKGPGLLSLVEFLETARPEPTILSHVTVIDRHATPIFNSSTASLRQGVSVTDRDYFKYLKNTPGDPVYISVPSRGRNTGLLIIRIARRINTPDGAFDGVIFTAILADSLTHPFQTLRPGGNSAAGLIGLDGKTRAWSASGQFQAELDASDWPIWPELLTSPNGLTEDVALPDGIARNLAFRRLENYPLVAVIGVAAVDAIASSRSFALSAVAMASLATLIIAVLTTAILRDIRQVRALQQEVRERRRAETEAIHATEIKTAFLATMSHEVRTPINAILGLFELIEQADIPDRQKRQAQAGQTAANDLFKQLTNVLDASRLEAKSLELSRQAEPVTPMIAELAQLLEAAIKTSDKDITASSQIDPDVPETMIMDRRRVEQIVLNFIDNAVKFTQAGRIDLRASVLRTGPAPKLRISVRDTGIGMRKSDMQRLFKRFSQLNSKITRTAGGAGLGLSICKDLADLMQAELTVDSVEGRGTTFALILMIEPLP